MRAFLIPMQFQGVRSVSFVQQRLNPSMSYSSFTYWNIRIHIQLFEYLHNYCFTKSLPDNNSELIPMCGTCGVLFVTNVPFVVPIISMRLCRSLLHMPSLSPGKLKNKTAIPMCPVDQHNFIFAFKYHYSWIGPPVETHEKSICQQTIRAMTIRRPPLESSRRGEFRSAVIIFVYALFWKIYWIPLKIMPKQT